MVATWPNLTFGSDQRDNLALCFAPALDVASSRAQARMSSELLNVAKAAADLANPSGYAGYESSAPRVRWAPIIPTSR